jgi:serine/threonine protein kinase
VIDCLQAIVADHEESGLGDLLQRLLQLEPSRRIKAKDALRHPFFDALKSSSSCSTTDHHAPQQQHHQRRSSDR